MEALFDGRVESRVEVNPSEYRMRLAHTIAAAAAKVLGIETPQIKFFYRSRGDNLLGYAHRNEIYLAADVPDMELLSTTIHELRHCWQDQNSEWRFRTERERERDAVVFELS